MLNRFLKRFENLEVPKEGIIIDSAGKASRRFERLEVGDKRIEIAITDKYRTGETAPEGTKYYCFCPYCGKYSLSSSPRCETCSKPLKRNHSVSAAHDVTPETQTLLKKCSCGAMNQKDRRDCWVCGKDFFLTGEQETEKAQRNTIVLNLNGKEYKSTDRDLPLRVAILMDKIRREGYSKELIDEWVKQENKEAKKLEDARLRRMHQVRMGMFVRLFGLALLILFFIFQFRIVGRIFN